ncbi:MAG: murein biosynthesis integral membrane protein MurJ [Gammaproteobacteria bacterium]|nr:murein biosynthesis integral membrane protein MurJ [Gammaproteobacteria bacterium]
MRSAGIVSGVTLLSRVLGFLRDMVIARFFGAGVGADAFFVAFRIPNFFRRLFAEGAFSQAFVPILSELKETRSDSEVRSFLDYVIGALGIALLVMTLIAVVTAPLLIWLVAPGFASDPDKQLMTGQLLRITFPYLLFISLTAAAGGILNSYGRFAGPAFAPVLLNLSLIVATIWIAPGLEQPVFALAWAVFVGGILQLALQLPLLAQIRMLPRPRFRRRDPGVQRVVKLMIPALFGASVSQVNLLFDTVLASLLATGSVSWLYYSDRLLEFPLGVFGIALATVVLPALSREHARGDGQQFSATLDWALRLVLTVAFPAAVGLAILAAPMLTTLFHYGAFSASDVAQATRSLWGYAPALIAVMAVKVLAPGFYSRQDMKTPVRIAVIAMLSNMVFNLILIMPLAHAGLALATSLSAFIQAVLLARALRRVGISPVAQGFTLFIGRVLFATTAMALGLLYFAPAVTEWLQASALWRATWLAALVAGGALVYLVTLRLAGVSLLELLRRRAEVGE